MKQAAPDNFEAKLTQLQNIVGELEKGVPALGESLELYKRGIELVKACQSELKDAANQVEILSGEKLELFDGNQ